MGKEKDFDFIGVQDVEHGMRSEKTESGSGGNYAGYDNNNLELKMATFNVWGLYISRNRQSRMKAIANHLKGSDYSIIGLQEVWIRKDYEYLAEELRNEFPFSYYFKSGQMGSGMVTFSKYPIKQAVFHRFLLNGQAHHVWQGDWWSGKGVGLTRIQISESLSVNFYNTHLHAEYNKKTNKYLGHRISQLQQLFQFVQMSSAIPETEKFMNVIAGDLNTQSGCFSFDLFLKQNIFGGNMKDSATIFAKQNQQDIFKTGNTFNVNGNTFGKKKKPEQRIDYILFSGSDNFGVKNCTVLREDRLAGDGKISLSDHCLLEVTFELTENGSVKKAVEAEDEEDCVPDVAEQCNLIKKSIAVLSKDIHYTKKSQKRHLIISAVQLVLFLAITIGVSLVLTFDTLPLIITLLAFVLAPGFLIGAILSGLIALVWMPEELAHLHGFASQWNLALMARGVDTLPISGIVDAMDSTPEAIEQMCTITGSKFDKTMIKQILNEKRKSVAETPRENGKKNLTEDGIEVESDKNKLKLLKLNDNNHNDNNSHNNNNNNNSNNKNEFSTIQIEPLGNAI